MATIRATCKHGCTDECVECLLEEHDAALRLAYARAATAEQRAEKLSEELEQAKHLLTCESIKAERAENRAEAAEAKISNWGSMCEAGYSQSDFHELVLRLEAAEARIKEAEGQEPAVNITDGAVTWSQVPKGFNGQLFFGPLPPADVQEPAHYKHWELDYSGSTRTGKYVIGGATPPDYGSWESEKLYTRPISPADVAELQERVSGLENDYKNARRDVQWKHELHVKAEKRIAELEAAEARIKEAEGQEPIYQCWQASVSCWQDCTETVYNECMAGGYKSRIVYTRPAPPADVVELQAKYDRLDQIASDAAELNNTQAQHIAELERKLAEQQAYAMKLIDFVQSAQVASGVCCCGDAMDAHASPMSCGHSPVDEWDYAVSSLAEEYEKRPREELNTLLAKARAEAVPSAINAAPNEPTWEEAGAYVRGFNACREAMLAAAPKPVEEK